MNNQPTTLLCNLQKREEPLSISEDPFHPLEVEITEQKYHYEIIEGESVQRPQHHVSFIHPGGTGSMTRTRLLNISPQTALNLLTWLEQARETLEHLAKEQQRCSSSPAN